jgi:Lipocalin-like domain
MKKITTLVLVAVLFFACNPEKDCATNVASISGAYKITAYTYRQTPTSPEQDYYPILFPDACERDDELSFNANGTYQKTDAGTACTPPENDNGTWSLSANTITIDGDPGPIESFDCKTLVISSADFLVTGDKLKITLVKK